MTQAERILEARKAARNGAFYSDVIERTPLDLHMDRARLECGHEATVLAAQREEPPKVFCGECAAAWIKSNEE